MKSETVTLKKYLETNGVSGEEFLISMRSHVKSTKEFYALMESNPDNSIMKSEDARYATRFYEGISKKIEDDLNKKLPKLKINEIDKDNGDVVKTFVESILSKIRKENNQPVTSEQSRITADLALMSYNMSKKIKSTGSYAQGVLKGMLSKKAEKYSDSIFDHEGDKETTKSKVTSKSNQQRR
jgi:hypothetical protein